MAKFYKGKPVFISVYVEKTGRRRVSSNKQHQRHHDHHHHHYHHLHRSTNQEVIHDQYKNGGSGRGYSNRRAELLHYSQSLRHSAGSAASTLLPPKPDTPPNNQQPTSNAVAVHRSRNYARTPTCLGNWRILIPNFLRSFTVPKDKKERRKKKQSGSTTNKMKALVKGFELQKKKTSITKLLSTFRKRG